MDQFVAYALTTGLGLISALVALIWKFMRDEQERNTKALELKASESALKRAEEQAAKDLAGVKEYFRAQLERQHEDNQARLKELSIKQDREIDWLKDQVGEVKQNLAEMRREQNAGFTHVLSSLQNIIIRNQP